VPPLTSCFEEAKDIKSKHRDSIHKRRSELEAEFVNWLENSFPQRFKEAWEIVKDCPSNNVLHGYVRIGPKFEINIDIIERYKSIFAQISNDSFFEDDLKSNHIKTFLFPTIDKFFRKNGFKKAIYDNRDNEGYFELRW
jgi:hypothetical protein